VDCVVADAVAVEPVSTPKFPANREKNRDFFNFKHHPRRGWLTSPMNSEAWSAIPYSMKQGIISAEQGILAQEQGFLSFKTEIVTGWSFRDTQVLGTQPGIRHLVDHDLFAVRIHDSDDQRALLEIGRFIERRLAHLEHQVSL